jgi:hypothetical protein
MSTMTEARLAEIEARANAATPTAWRWSKCYELHDGIHWALETDESARDGRVCSINTILFSTSERDIGGVKLDETPELQLIANAPEDIRALIAEVRRLRDWIAKAPQPNGITVTDIEAFRKWQREALGGGE